jgi:hypothetical protein
MPGFLFVCDLSIVLLCCPVVPLCTMSDIIAASTDSPNNTTTPVTTARVKRVNRLIWAKTEATAVQDGKQGVIHPFLFDSNVKEKIFLRYLVAQSPFAASYGNLESGWNDMVNDINKEIGDDGQPVFSPPLVVRTAKDRLKDYVKFANGIHSHVVNSTGCDNIPPRTEIQRLLIDVLELYREHQKKDKAAKDAAAMKKKDRSDAVECRDESLAIYVESTKELEQMNSGDTTTAKKHRKSAPPQPTDGMDVLMDKKNLMEGRKLDFAEKQHDDKKDILERYMALQEKRIDSQDAQIKAQKEKDSEIMMMMMQQNRMMMEMLQSRKENM